jgi:hypothetical protein
MFEHRLNAFPPDTAHPLWERSLDPHNNVFPLAASIEPVHDMCFQYPHSYRLRTRDISKHEIIIHTCRYYPTPSDTSSPPCSLIFSFILAGPQSSPHSHTKDSTIYKNPPCASPTLRRSITFPCHLLRCHQRSRESDGMKVILPVALAREMAGTEAFRAWEMCLRR